jgi:hypothetical protein
MVYIIGYLYKDNISILNMQLRTNLYKKFINHILKQLRIQKHKHQIKQRL